MKKLWIISIGTVTTLVAITLIVVSSYSLFSQDMEVTNHLVAGELKLELKRTDLTWLELDSEGYLIEKNNDETYDASELISLFDHKDNATTQNYIVPGIFYEAQMKIINAGNVAFDYYIEIVLKNQSNSLAEQLEISYKMGSEVVTKKLSEGLTLGSNENPLGQAITAQELDFTLKIEFIKGLANNNAQALEVDFDFIIHAVQSTTKQ